MMQNILKLLGVQEAEAAEPIAPSLQQFLQQDYRKSQNLTAPENLRKPDPVSKRIKAAISKGSNLDAEAKKVAAEAVRNLPKNPSDITDQSIAEEKAMYDKSIQENIMRGEAAVDQADDEYLRKNDKPKYIMKMLSKYSAPGVSQKLSMAMPDVVSPFQNDIMMMNAEDVMKRFEVGKFDNETLAPDAANYRDRLLKQIARADSGDKTDLAPILRGIGNLTGTKLAEGYETNDARSNRLSELLGASNIKTSGVYDKNDRTLIDLYKGQKLPPSVVSASTSTDLPRAVGRGLAGKPQKELTRQEAMMLSDATAGLGMITTTKNRLNELKDKFSINAVRSHAVSPFLGSMVSAVSKDSAATMEVISLIANIAATYALKISGKAVTDKEQARLQIVQQLSAFTDEKALATGMDKLLTDFERQLSLEATALGPRRTDLFTGATGVDPRIVSKNAKELIPSKKSDESIAPQLGFDSANAQEWLKAKRAKTK